MGNELSLGTKLAKARRLGAENNCCRQTDKQTDEDTAKMHVQIFLIFSLSISTTTSVCLNFPRIAFTSKKTVNVLLLTTKVNSRQFSNYE